MPLHRDPLAKASSQYAQNSHPLALIHLPNHPKYSCAEDTGSSLKTPMSTTHRYQVVSAATNASFCRQTPGLVGHISHLMCPSEIMRHKMYLILRRAHWPGQPLTSVQVLSTVTWVVCYKTLLWYVHLTYHKNWAC